MGVGCEGVMGVGCEGSDECDVWIMMGECKWVVRLNGYGNDVRMLRETCVALTKPTRATSTTPPADLSLLPPPCRCVPSMALTSSSTSAVIAAL